MKLFLFTFGLLVFSAEFSLKPRPDLSSLSHNEKLTKIPYGSFVVATNGDRVRVGEYIAQGGTSVIYKAYDDPTKVIKIAKNDSVRFNRMYRVSSAELIKQGFKAPKVYPSSASNSEFLVVEYIDFDFTLTQLLRGETDFGVARAALAVRELDKLVKDAVSKTGVDDLHTENLVYSHKRGWIFLDSLYYPKVVPSKRVDHYKSERNRVFFENLCRRLPDFNAAKELFANKKLFWTSIGLTGMGAFFAEELTLGFVIDHWKEIYRPAEEENEQKKGSPKTP